jgi:hypothetical protein
MLAQLDRDGWELESAEERVAAYGDAFPIAALVARESLVAGDQAKLLFLIRTSPGEYGANEHVERMWVTALGRNEDEYIAALDNEARYPGPTHLGMPVHFCARHVVEVWRDGQEHPDAFEAAV